MFDSKIKVGSRVRVYTEALGILQHDRKVFTVVEMTAYGYKVKLPDSDKTFEVMFSEVKKLNSFHDIVRRIADKLKAWTDK